METAGVEEGAQMMHNENDTICNNAFCYLAMCSVGYTLYGKLQRKESVR